MDAIVFDKDNTLTAPYESVIHPLAVRGLESAQSVFGSNRVAVLSNSAGTKDDVGYRDALAIEQSLGMDVIRHDEKKPGGMQEVLDHFSLTDPTRLCVVGDRLLTDVVFGNLHGMLTVHTLPLCRGLDNQRDNKIAKAVRRIENGFLYNTRAGQWLQRTKTIPHKHWNGQDSLILQDESKDQG